LTDDRDLIPEPTPHTVLAIFAAYEDDAEYWDGYGFNVGSLGHECSRALWYDFRWASEPERPSGRIQSIFATGSAWEDRLIADLERIGVTVTGQQDKIRLAGGHVRGKIDGRGFGLPVAPKTEHLFEFKSAKAADFRKIKREGVEKAKPTHYAQLQLGMHAFGLTRAGYLVVNKDDDDRHFERVEYNAEWCLREIARVERLIELHEPPSRISNKPTVPPCRFCRHKPICFENTFPRVTCRSCLHSTPSLHGDATWECDRWNKPLAIEEQKAACPTHLYLPPLIPGERIAVDEERETVTYRLHDGREWTDGLTKEETPT
jgi:hypothetical protein